MDDETVVLVDDDGNACGTAPKRTVHHASTPLHLAFSCYVFDQGYEQVLITRRALGKRTWPGVWTNSFCGHPSRARDIPQQVALRALHELGVRVSPPRAVLPDFRYRAVMENGVVENEICPVHVATTSDPVAPNPEEVADFQWLPWRRFCEEVLAGTRAVSPWCRLQVAELASQRTSAWRGHADTPRDEPSPA